MNNLISHPIPVYCITSVQSANSFPALPSKEILDVKHRILKIVMDPHIGIFHLAISSAYFLIVHLAQILPASIAGLVRIVDGRNNADARRRFAIKIAQVVRQLLEITHAVTALREDFVQQDEVMSWARGSRDCGVRLEEEVPVAVLGDGVVDELSTVSMVSEAHMPGTNGYVIYLQCRMVGCLPFPSEHLRPLKYDRTEYDGVCRPRRGRSGDRLLDHIDYRTLFCRQLATLAILLRALSCTGLLQPHRGR